MENKQNKPVNQISRKTYKTSILSFCMDSLNMFQKCDPFCT